MFKIAIFKAREYHCLIFVQSQIESQNLTILVIDTFVQNISRLSQRVALSSTCLVADRTTESHHSSSRHICLRSSFFVFYQRMSLANTCLVVARKLESHHSNHRYICLSYQYLKPENGIVQQLSSGRQKARTSPF